MSEAARPGPDSIEPKRGREGRVDELRLREQDIVWRQVEDEIVILDMKASVYASLNNAGRVLWLRLVDGATLDDLVEELMSVYGLDPDTARVDAQAFVAALNQQGLLG
jgi:hypothetical protein